MEYTLHQQAKLNSNIYKYFFVILSNKRVFAAIFAVYLLSLGTIEEKQLGLMLLIANIMSFILEIPSGYMSDKLGHKNTLILSRLFLVISSLGYIFCTSFIGLLIASILWALGISFFSGAGSALMHDTLKALGKDNQYSEIIGKINSYSFLVSMFLSASVPALMVFDNKIPFYVSLIVTFIGFLASISLRRIKDTHEEKQRKKETKILDVFKESISAGFMQYGFYFSFLYGTTFAFLIYRDPFQLAIGANLALFGLFFAAGRVITVIFSRYTGVIKDKIKTIDNLVLYSMLTYSILFSLIALVDNKYVVIAAFLIADGLIAGSFTLKDSFLIKIVENSQFKATHLSIVSQFRAMFEGFFAFILGALITIFSYKISFTIFVCIFISVTLIMYLNIIRLKRRAV